MLKLTDIDGNPIYAAVKHIEWMIQRPNKTEVCIAGLSHFVTETPEQILAMPEMIMFNSAMIVPKGLTWDGYNSNLEAR